MAFQMAYSHTIGQYSVVSMVVVKFSVKTLNSSGINNMSEKSCREYMLV